MTQVIAVDWSGDLRNAPRTIWVAVVVDERLVELENGREPGAAIARVIDLAGREPRTAVGLDFAFSFPKWFCHQEGWTTGHEVWAAIAGRAEDLLRTCPRPFWGRRGTVRPRDLEVFRRTEREIGGQPKSIFQIAGPGAVGTGSLRGMGQLSALAAAGFSIWPFDPPGWPLAMEIYPRLLTRERVVKSAAAGRRGYLRSWHRYQDPVLLERAAGSEDAFDAAVSAFAIARHVDQLAELPRFPTGSPYLVEGRIWTPSPPFPPFPRRS